MEAQIPKVVKEKTTNYVHEVHEAQNEPIAMLMHIPSDANPVSIGNIKEENDHQTFNVNDQLLTRSESIKTMYVCSYMSKLVLDVGPVFSI